MNQLFEVEGTPVEAVANWSDAQATPDLMFLDIQWSNGTRFNIFERTTHGTMPAWVVVNNST